MTDEVRRKRIPGVQANRTAISELKQELSRISSAVEDHNNKIREILRIERESSPRNELQARLDHIVAVLRDLKEQKAAELRNRTTLQNLYNELKGELAPEKGKGGKPMSVSEIDSKIKEIEFRIISDTLDVKTEDALVSEMQELKRKKQSLGATEQKSRTAFETKEKLDESYLDAKKLTEEINNKHKEADEVRGEIKKIAEQSKTKNPQVEAHEKNIQMLKAKREEISKKIAAQLDEIKKKEEEYHVLEKEIMLAKANEQRKDKIREKIHELEDEKNRLLSERGSCDPAKFDVVIVGLEQLCGRSTFALPGGLAFQVLQAGVKCPTKAEEVQSAVEELKTKQKEFARVVVDRVKDIDTKVSDLDKRILIEKKALEELPPTDTRLLRFRRD
jgi:uncharacterized coiled-coil DUF342 family protein